VDGDRPDCKKSIEIRVPGSESAKSGKDQKKKTQTVQENRLWSLIQEKLLILVRELCQ
jgi:hypothetical protein